MFPQPRSPGQIVSPLLKQVAAILNPVVKAAPALIDPLYVMAQVKYLSGEPAGPGGQVGTWVLLHLFSYPDTWWPAAPELVSTGCLPGVLYTHTHTHTHTLTLTVTNSHTHTYAKSDTHSHTH